MDSPRSAGPGIGARIELRRVERGEPLVLGAAQPPAEGQVLADLQIGVDVLDLRQLGPDALDELIGRDAALGMRLQLHEQAGEIFRGNDRPRPGEGHDTVDRRVLQQGVGHFGLPVDHGGEGNVLAALDRDEDEARVLLGKQALGDGDVEPAGEDGQRHGRRQGERLVIEHPDEAAIVAALH